MSDLISRQAAIEDIRTMIPKDAQLDIKWIEMWLMQLPSAQPDQPPYVAEIESEYRKAVNMPYIKKPLAKALYEVWKKHDRDDAERKE